MSKGTEFFQVGGTLSEDSPSYIERPADSELLAALDAGELCLVLAPRQTGKSSLMVHVSVRLKEKGVRAGIVDLQPLGSQRDPGLWFSDVAYQIERTLRLETDAGEWWDAHRRLGPTQRFMVFLEDVVLAEIQGEVVLFFDEVDSVLKLPFSDDFFTTIRSIYNARTTNPILRRLTFVLIGVATATSFIKDRSRTPFNIGKSIRLDDFDREASEPFEKVLGPDSERLIDRIFYWTEGQPLLVQKLAAAAYRWPQNELTPERVDEEVDRAFLKARIEQDTHLKFIRDYLVEDNRKLRKTLKTYRAVLEAKEVPHDDQSPIHSRLKLAGVVRTLEQKLASRNRIYQKVFDIDWVRENTPKDVTKMVAYGASSALVLVLLWFSLIQPLFFPRFSKIQTYPWLVKDIYYTEESVFKVDLAVPDAGIARIKLDDREIPWQGRAGDGKATSIQVKLDHLPVGPSEHRLRFYGGMWKENFETSLIVVSYPVVHWKPLTDLEMLTVPGGCFQMGCGDWDGECQNDETPVHRVCLDTFEIDKYEVTQDQWERIMGYNSAYFDKKGGRYPVERVSWNHVQEFIRRLNKLTNERFRLPTEVEWEYAARSGGKPEKYAGGNELDALGWYSANSGGETHLVGRKDPNRLGIYDMSGNVWEWCQDWYDPKYYEISPVENPKGPATGVGRVVRGGSWDYDARYCRSAIRLYGRPDARFNFLGFRLARSVSLGS